ncbi:MAG: hypothetical protein IPG07_15275 [Crocinitomicaceae bacterium]|nr:hypothetical protein [Crocinitomicaceae bacterium]
MAVILNPWILKQSNNRGQLAFETTDPQSSGWNGNFKGEPQPIGVFVYVAVVTRYDGEVVTLSGDVFNSDNEDEKISLLIFASMLSVIGNSQDFHLSQYDAVALNANPGMTGVFLRENTEFTVTIEING